MLYDQSLYDDYLYHAQYYTAEWSNAYQFTYLAGTTVNILATLTAVIPGQCTVDLYAGESLSTLSLVESGILSPLIFISPTSGLANLYVKIVMTTTEQSATPVISVLAIEVSQQTSLYTIATQILSDGLTPSNSTWLIDTELQKYLIPYGLVSPESHRAAIARVAEAAGGVAFQDRHGVIQVQAGNYITRTTSGVSVDTIGDRIINSSSPVSVVKNRIQVLTYPYVAQSDQTIWTLTDDLVINASQTRRFEVAYTGYDAVIDGHVVLSSAPSGATIASETHYSWGAVVEILGSADGQILTMSISGKPLVVSGAQLVERTDGASIRRNGDRAMAIKENKMIQTSALAGQIADATILTTAQEARDIELEWRGDPTLELGDKILIGLDDAAIVSQEFNFNGALSARLLARKV